MSCFLLSGGLLPGIVAAVQSAFELLWGHYVQALAAYRPPVQAAGVSHDPKEPKRALRVNFGLPPRPQFHEKTEREKKEEGKKE